MIIWSHWAWSSFDPGALPLNVEQVDPSKMTEESQNMWNQVKKEVFKIKRDRERNREEIKEKDMEEVELKQKEYNKIPPIDSNNTQDKALSETTGDVDDLEGGEEIESSPSMTRKSTDTTSTTKESVARISDHATKKLIDSFSNFWSRCNSPKPPRTHHCSQCGRWVARMDHHCPWIDNCVGVKNQKQFVLFLSYLLVGCCYGMGSLLLDCLIWLINKDPKYTNAFIILISLGTLFIQFMFWVFAYLMIQDQFDSIINDTSIIDRLKRTEMNKEREHWWILMKNVFDNESKIWWLLPTKVHHEVTIESQY